MNLISKAFVLPLFLIAFQAHSVVNKIDIQVDQSEFKEHFKVEDKFSFSSAKAKVNGGGWQSASLRTRGNSCLGAPRRCFRLEVDTPIELKMSETKTWEVSKLNLTSMWQDNGYINHKLGMGLAKKLSLLKLKNTYVLLTVNGKAYGLYIALQKPTKALKHSAYVARRRDDGNADTEKFRSKHAGSYTEDDFVNAYYEMYERIKDRDSNLYSYLETKMNVKAYFRLLTLHSLLKNGDYTDELFFYARPLEETSGKIYFDILPWDFEDLFNNPHDGKLNKKAKKKGLFDDTILYSFEDPLDIAIGKDSALYSKFKVVAKSVLQTELTNELIDSVVDSVKGKITPYLDFPGVYQASKEDEIWGDTVYSKTYILNLLEKRRKFLKERRVELLNKL